MTKPFLQIGRNLSQYRVSAYECSVEGSAVNKGKRLTGWYGMFHEQRLIQEIAPKLAEYASQGASYPFLITSHLLEGKADLSIKGDVKFKPRRPRSVQQNEAVVYSSTRYELLR